MPIISTQYYPWVYTDSAGVLRGYVDERGNVIPLAGGSGVSDAELSALFSALPGSTTGISLRSRSTHLGVDPAQNVQFADGTSLESWKGVVQVALGGISPSAPVITSSPTIAGTKAVGSTLTATPGAVTEGSGGSHTNVWQWFQTDSTGLTTPIVGATAITLVLTSLQYNQRINVSQKSVDSTGASSSSSSSLLTTAVTGTAPSNSLAPSLSPSGTQAVGTAINVSAGTWTGAVLYGYQILVGGVPTGARVFQAGTTYVYNLLSTQQGLVVTANVIGQGSDGLQSAAVTSSNSATVAGSNPVVNTAAPQWPATVRLEVAASLTAGTWTGTINSTRRYDVYRNGTNAANLFASNVTTSWTPHASAGLVAGDLLYILETVTETATGTTYTKFSVSATLLAASVTLAAQVLNASYSWTAGSAITASQPIGGVGGTQPYTYSCPSLGGTGVTMAGGTGIISGTPSAFTTTSFLVTVTDAVGATATASFTAVATAISLNIVASITGAQTFASMSGYAQLLGSSRQLSTVSDSTGVTATGTVPTPTGTTTLRLGKITDPIDSSRQVIFAAARSSDGPTYGHNGRCEFAPPQTPGFTQRGPTYWVGLEVYIPSARFATGGASNVLQIHNSDNSLDVPSGPFVLNFNPAGRIAPNACVSLYRIYCANPYAGVPPPYTQDFEYYSDNNFNGFGAYPRDTWVQWIIKYRGSADGSSTGIFAAWMNGVQLFSRTGINIGMNTPNFPNDYLKTGFDDFGTGGGTNGAFQLTRSVFVVQDNNNTVSQIQTLFSGGGGSSGGGGGSTSVSFQQSVGGDNGAGGTQLILSLTATSAGNFLFIGFVSFNAPSSVQDNTLTDWTLIQSGANSYLYCRPNAPAGITSVTVTAASGQMAGIACEISGLVTSSVVDQAPAVVQQTTVTSWASATASNTYGHDLALAFITTFDSSGETFSPAAGWTGVSGTGLTSGKHSQSGNCTIYLAYQDAPTTGSYTASGTNTPAATVQSAIALLKVA